MIGVVAELDNRIKTSKGDKYRLERSLSLNREPGSTPSLSYDES